MKTAVIVVLCIAIAFGGGLLIYGATLGAATSLGLHLGELLPPDAPDAYAHGIAEYIATGLKEDKNVTYKNTFYPETNPSKDPAIFAVEEDGWYDVFGKANSANSVLTRFSGANLVGNLITPVTYNQNRCKQFCMNSHFEINSAGGTVVSDNYRVRVQIAPFQVDGVYISRAWAGSQFNSAASMYVYFNNQQLEYQSAVGAIESYDPATNDFKVAFGAPSKTKRDRDLDREVPYKTYDLLTLPIYLGGEDKDDSSPVDSSVVDGSTVSVTAPTEKTPYYVLTFSEDLSKAQIADNLNERLNKALGEKMSKITLEKADFVVEIWESGVFRQVSAKFIVNAKINGKQGSAEIDMSYKFYYDDDACNIYSLIEDADWVKYLNDASKAEFQTGKAAWQAKTAQSKK